MVRGIPFTDHVHHINNKYQVSYNLNNGEFYYYGSYDTLIEALMVRDKMAFENYPEPKYKHIQYNGYSYIIRKYVDGELVNFGSYSTLSEAKKMVNYFKRKGWENCLHERLCYTSVKNIIFDNRCNKFIIRKMINKDVIDFGRFDTYEEAVEEVELLKKCNWSMDALCESIDETKDGDVVWLNRNM